MSTPARESSVDAAPSGRFPASQGPAPAAAPRGGPGPARTLEEFLPIDELAEGMADLGVHLVFRDEEEIAAPKPATPQDSPRQGEDSLPPTRPVTPDELGEQAAEPEAPEGALQEEGAVGGDRGDLQEPDPFTLQARIRHLEDQVQAIPQEATEFVERRLGELSGVIMRDARAEAVRLAREAIEKIEAAKGYRKGPQLGDLNNQLKEERLARKALEKRIDNQRLELDDVRCQNRVLQRELEALRRQGSPQAPADIPQQEFESLWREVTRLSNRTIDLRHWLSDMAIRQATSEGPDRSSPTNWELDTPRRRSPLAPASGYALENVEEPGEAAGGDAGPVKTPAGGRGQGRRPDRPY